MKYNIVQENCLEETYSLGGFTMMEMSAKRQRSSRFLGYFIAFLFLLILLPENTLSATYDFDEGIEYLARNLLRKETARDSRIAVFGYTNLDTKERWKISAHIEDGIIDQLINSGYEIIERSRINDVLESEIKRSADLWFDEKQTAEVGKLVGADIVVTGNYTLWADGDILKIKARAIKVENGKIVGASHVQVHTDRIEDKLTPEVSTERPRQKKAWQTTTDKSKLTKETTREKPVTIARKTSPHARPTLPPHVVKYIKMLRSGDPRQQRYAAKKMIRSSLYHPRLLEIVNQELLKGYQSNMDDRLHVDTMAWLCKVLGTSGERRYSATLQKVAAETSNRKLRKYAERSLGYLE